MMKTSIVVLMMMWLIMTDPLPPDDWRSFNTKIERFVTFEMAVIPKKKEVNRLVKIVN